jgi:prephenate dehydrogenase
MDKQSFGLIGVGAFGSLAARHLVKHFDLILHDPLHDVSALAKDIGARISTLEDTAHCDIVLIAVPVQKFSQVLKDVAPHLKTGALVIDVCSVKIKPIVAMQELLPSDVAIVGTHPLFGPQSGKNGIKGLTIAVCNVRGDRGDDVANFCKEKLELRVMQITPEEHDQEAAYVQGLTHMLARIIVDLNLPEARIPTRAYELLAQMVEMLRYDSDELFHAIERENPFVMETKKSFFAAARRLEEKLSPHQS